MVAVIGMNITENIQRNTPGVNINIIDDGKTIEQDFGPDISEESIQDIFRYR